MAKFKFESCTPFLNLYSSIIQNIGLDNGANYTISPFSSTKYAKKSMDRLCSDTGIKCNPYKFRKTFGSLLAQAGEDTINVATLMGHKKLQTTYQYYIRLDHKNLQNTIAKL